MLYACTVSARRLPNMRKILLPVLGTYFLWVFALPYWQTAAEDSAGAATSSTQHAAADTATAAADSAPAAPVRERLPVNTAPTKTDSKPPADSLLRSVKTVMRLTAEDSIRRYIWRHKDLAVAEMHRVGIPASIKLAQGILESRYGTSELATAANNHFGLKATKEWRGHIYYVYSQEWNAHLRRSEKVISAFRAFATAEESYRHHSDFVRFRDHYKHLFKFSRVQYRAWAEGLAKAGYATDPAYAAKLISLIERFHLHQYDRMAAIALPTAAPATTTNTTTTRYIAQ